MSGVVYLCGATFEQAPLAFLRAGYLYLRSQKNIVVMRMPQLKRSMPYVFPRSSEQVTNELQRRVNGSAYKASPDSKLQTPPPRRKLFLICLNPHL